MFDRELWIEILHTIRKNKLRTVLTAIGVFWGIFMLILLLGAGNGLSNATIENFKNSATNAIYVWPQRTSKPYMGFQAGRRISFEMEDVEVLKERVPEMEYISPRVQLGELICKSSDKEGNFNIRGELPDMFFIETLEVIKGRKLNQKDIDEKRRVTVIGREVAKKLYGSESITGEYLNIQGKDFLIVGIYKKESSMRMGQGNPEEEIFIPLSVAQLYLPIPNIFHWFVCTVNKKANIKEVEERIKGILKEQHQVHPADRSGVGAWNMGDFFGKFQSLFAGINIFIWLVGIGSLIAGIVGVSNVMLISVKERTKEIGLRKALGATPKSLIRMVLLESLALTFVAGYLGLFAGTGLITIMEFLLEKFSIESDYFKRPEIDLTTGIAALVLIVLAGILAGIYPARQAAKMDPVEALRNE
jgi:putative ABC transport system permease protein